MANVKRTEWEGIIEATIEWDDGDWSVGIGPGYSEDTGASITCGPFVTWFSFMPDEGLEPKNWTVTEVQLNYVDKKKDGTLDSNKFIGIAMSEEPQTPVYHPEHKWMTGTRPVLLSDFPPLLEVIESCWREFKLEMQELTEREW